MSVVAIRRPWRVDAHALATVAGACALVLAVACSWWIAAGSADGLRWLELPGGANPAWVDGPLRGLASTVGSLPPSAVSIALLGLFAAYLVAVACAGAISLRAAIAAVVLANLAFTLGPSLVSTDVFGYIAYARDFAVHGLNPYVSAPAAAPHDAVLPFVYWRGATSPYGPLFTIGSAPLGLASVPTALWIFKAVAGASSVVLALLMARSARRRKLNPAAAAMLVGLNPVLLVYAVSGAHNDLLAVLLLVAGIWLVLQQRESWGASAAVAAASVKLTLGVALPFVLLGARRRGRAALAAAVATAVGATASLILFGPHLFDQLHRIASDRQFDIAFSGPDRLGVLLGTGITGGVRAALLAAAVVGVLVAFVWAARGGDWIAAAGWATLCLLASIASLAPWYLVWLLPLAALGRSRALIAAALTATGYLIAVHLPLLGHGLWLASAGR